jgi:soluble lytic murein transglycosylase-like protein
MSSFSWDFAGFVMGAALVAAPGCAVVTSWAYFESGSPVSSAVDGKDVQVAGNVVSRSQGTQTLARIARTNAGRWITPGMIQSTSLHDGVTLGRDRGFEHSASVGAITLHERDTVRSAESLRILATNAARLCGVPVGLFHALIQRESGWRPYVVSSSGAVGLGQIKPSTLRGVSPTLNAWEPWDNLLGSACYLRQMYERTNPRSWTETLYHYREGPYRRRTSQAARRYAADILEGSTR